MSARVEAAARGETEWRSDTVALAMWVFLASEVMFFGPLFMGYVHARTHDAVGFALASHHTHPWLGTINTAILLTSSLAMALAVRAARLGAAAAVRRLLAITAAFGIAFLVIKGAEYHDEWRDGVVPALRFTYAGAGRPTVEAFFYLYFVMTGVHAIHLAIGIAIVAWQWRGSTAIDAARADAVEATGLYWHFVDGLWVFLYPLFYLVELYR